MFGFANSGGAELPHEVYFLLPFLQMFDTKQTAFQQEKGEVLYCKPGN